jgi:hypothetical protein
MKERRDFIRETKTEMINDLLNSSAFKAAKFISLGLVITGGLGYVFKVLAFTNNHYNKFKNSIN